MTSGISQIGGARRIDADRRDVVSQADNVGPWCSRTSIIFASEGCPVTKPSSLVTDRGSFSESESVISSRLACVRRLRLPGVLHSLLDVRLRLMIPGWDSCDELEGRRSRIDVQGDPGRFVGDEG